MTTSTPAARPTPALLPTDDGIDWSSPRGSWGKWRGIVKLQASLSTSRGAQQVLVYDESRRIYDERDMSKAVRKFMRGKSKLYAYAHITHEGQVSFDGYAPEQPW